MKKKYMEYCSALVLIAFGAWGWYETSSWNVPVSSGRLAPTTYPRILFTAILFFGGVILVRTLVKTLLQKQASGELEQLVDIHLLHVAGTVVLFVLYILALRAFGFLLPTPIFLFLSMLLFGERKWPRMVLISVAGTLVLYLFFVRLLHVHF